MDSKPLSCLPRGSIVTALKSRMSDKYDILSRRVLVRHVATDEQNNEIVTEGWASVQSSQGYVILSPVVSLCYTNSRWGSTRPIIKQCGHAAHMRCVETHTLSLHQRAAGDQPYDGRFAANIDDGEFLCPLCKQLSNILIPRDNFVDGGTGLAQSMQEVAMKDTESNSGKRKFKSGDEPKVSLRTLMTKGARPTESKANKLSEMGQKALKDFGAHLFQAMDVPWERNTASRRRNQRQWHPAIQRWDYEDEDDDDETNEDPEPKVKSVLRLLRQQHIAWAAVGHSAASLEAATRGVEEVLPFGVMSNTSDPWNDYGTRNKDNHPMLLELKRTLAGTSGLFEMLIDDIANELGSPESKTKGPCVLGTLLADILEGRSWYQCISQPHSPDPGIRDRLILWSLLTGLMSSMPCHVSRDGQISQRSEARAAAAAMWVVRGVGTQENQEGEPPVPLAVSRMFNDSKKPCHFPAGWGTLEPFAFGPEESQPKAPFRPAVASSFLYTPLLAWDLHTFAGAAFSTMLVNDVDDLPSSEDMLHLTRVLFVSKLIQALVTPGGIILPDEMQDDGCSDIWAPNEIESEGLALCRMIAHCKAKVQAQSLSSETSLLGNGEEIGPSAILSAVGQAVLPFARSVILLLRACTAVIRERKRKSRLESDKESAADKILDELLFASEIMSCEDGFTIFKAVKGPLPSALIDVSGSWFSMIDRWLIAVIGFELHHGSMGRNAAALIAPNSHVLRSDFEKPSNEQAEARASLKKNATMTESGQEAEENSEEMEIDETAPSGEVPHVQYFNNNIGGADADESDEELAEAMELDEEEIVIGFPEGVIGDIVPTGRHSGANDGPGDSSDDHSSSASEGKGGSSDREFAHVSKSPIVSYQPSLLARSGVGAVRQGTFFESNIANAVMSDMSHLGLVHMKGSYL